MKPETEQAVARLREWASPLGNSDAFIDPEINHVCDELEQADVLLTEVKKAMRTPPMELIKINTDLRQRIAELEAALSRSQANDKLRDGATERRPSSQET